MSTRCRHAAHTLCGVTVFVLTHELTISTLCLNVDCRIARQAAMPSRIKQQLFAAPLAREITARLRAPPRSEDGRSADGDAATAVSDDERAGLAQILSTAFRRLPSKRAIIEVSQRANTGVLCPLRACWRIWLLRFLMAFSLLSCNLATCVCRLLLPLLLQRAICNEIAQFTHDRASMADPGHCERGDAKACTHRHTQVQLLPPLHLQQVPVMGRRAPVKEQEPFDRSCFLPRQDRCDHYLGS